MIQLALLLVGVQAAQRHWLTLAAIGAIWGALGLGILIDPLDGVQNVTMHTLGLLLVFEGLATLVLGLLAHATGPLRVTRALAFVVPGLMIVDTPFRNVVLISILFGAALLVDGVIRIVATLLVRFPGWQAALFGSAIEIVLAVLAFTPWPVSYEATVPFCVGVAMMLSSWSVIRSALLLRGLPPHAPITSLPLFGQRRGWQSPVSVPQRLDGDDRAPIPDPVLIVHVWTPLASQAEPLRRPLLDRYVASVDKTGSVATGHTALEMPPDLYISHYRAAEQDRTASEFRQAIHAGKQNDVPGRFLPSYRFEADDWCESTAKVVFRRFDADRLRAFWNAYQQDPTYNLTNRNCSIVVAMALEAALEGILSRDVDFPPILRLVLHPELYLATVLRRRANTMTWTPGLVLDYARALQQVTEPESSSWVAVLGNALLRYRRARRRDRMRSSHERAGAECQPRARMR
ncbi:MAG: hypothetical protein JOZ42_11685 [Acetobacteraceae bacterium]|nr:hypothetical protein [Acetobacteraceae bacterium]